MEKIKLVIWDLDETFWKGTLSEGGIEIVSQNVEIVKELSRRGIINSISSKNDKDKTREVLLECGVWQYFVFPSIEWTPKGQNINFIIEQCQLRAPNVLFIDDNIGNRKEAEHYNPGINTADESIIGKILDMEELKGKDDRELSRLNQYKVLEQKAKAKAAYTDNLAFLRDSDIRICYINDCKKHKDRIFELINRTNQLNYTKIRLDEDELEKILNDENYHNTCIEVRDRFGNYGICGYYSIDLRQNVLVHFLFSCRILNLGIESYVYQKLGSPRINVIPPVASELSADCKIDWIQEVKKFDNEKSVGDKKRIRVLMLGGCDLEQMCHYINKDKFEIIKEFNYASPNGFPVHREHSVYLREIENLKSEDIALISSLPFGDKKMFDTLLFSNEYDVLVYSVLMNYTHELYRNREKGFRIAYGGYMNQQQLCDYLKMDEISRANFCKSYEFEGLQKKEDFISDLEWLQKKINKPILFINGAETDNVCENEPEAAQRHREMNNALDKFVNSSDHCGIIDVRKFVKSKYDHRDTIRHYQRTIYIDMAEELMQTISHSKVKVKLSHRVSSLGRYYLSKLIKIMNNR